MHEITAKNMVDNAYEILIQNLGEVICKYYASDEYFQLVKYIRKTFNSHIAMQADDFATDLYFGFIDSEGNELR